MTPSSISVSSLIHRAWYPSPGLIPIQGLQSAILHHDRLHLFYPVSSLPYLSIRLQSIHIYPSVSSLSIRLQSAISIHSVSILPGWGSPVLEITLSIRAPKVGLFPQRFGGCTDLQISRLLPGGLWGSSRWFPCLPVLRRVLEESVSRSWRRFKSPGLGLLPWGLQVFHSEVRIRSPVLPFCVIRGPVFHSVTRPSPGILCPSSNLDLPSTFPFFHIRLQSSILPSVSSLPFFHPSPVFHSSIRLQSSILPSVSSLPFFHPSPVFHSSIRLQSSILPSVSSLPFFHPSPVFHFSCLPSSQFFTFLQSSTSKAAKNMIQSKYWKCICLPAASILPSPLTPHPPPPTSILAFSATFAGSTNVI